MSSICFNMFGIMCIMGTFAVKSRHSEVQCITEKFLGRHKDAQLLKKTRVTYVTTVL